MDEKENRPDDESKRNTKTNKRSFVNKKKRFI